LGQRALKLKSAAALASAHEARRAARRMRQLYGLIGDGATYTVAPPGSET
jgi:hypothetical protein